MEAILRKLSQLSQVEIESLYRQVFETTHGQIVLEHIKKRGWVYQTTTAGFSGNPSSRMPDQIEMNVREGMRILALAIESDSQQPYPTTQEV